MRLVGRERVGGMSGLDVEGGRVAADEKRNEKWRKHEDNDSVNASA